MVKTFLVENGAIILTSMYEDNKSIIPFYELLDPNVKPTKKYSAPFFIQERTSKAYFKCDLYEDDRSDDVWLEIEHDYPLSDVNRNN